ncbi:MAG: class I SAM-dependent methyltransferase [Deltaproteobacteria bacterium]|nr:class I SAM-dependent methyltransferase [Deltaproteobacteria bacterium]
MDQPPEIEVVTQRGGNSIFGRFINHDLTYGEAVVNNFLRRISPFESAVDLGAGGGRDLGLVRQVCPAAETIAIECGSLYAENLRKKGHQVLELDIEHDPLPFETESIDIFIANQVLEHTKEIFWIFHQMTKNLKLGGHLIIGLPNIAALHNRFLFLFGIQPTQLKSHSAHIRGFTANDVRKLLDNVWPKGYSIQAFKGSQFYPFPPFLAKPMAKLFPSLAFSIFFLLKKQKSYQDQFVLFPVKNELETPFFTGQEISQSQYSNK